MLLDVIDVNQHDFLQKHLLRSVAQHHCEQKIVDVLINHDLFRKPFSNLKIHFSQRQIQFFL